MKKKRYKRRCGDFEIRVLTDGRVVMIAPDETLLEVARAVAPDNPDLRPESKGSKGGGSKKSTTKRQPG
jgi:hypothetical protein